MKPWILLFAALPACKDDAVDGLDFHQDKIDTMNTCFEPLHEKVDLLLDVANSWRMNTTGPVPDPVGLTFMEEVDGSLTIAYTAAGCTFDVTLKFYSPTGVQRNLDLGLPGSLN